MAAVALIIGALGRPGICEVRCTAGSFRFKDWEGDAHEPDIGLVEIIMSARPGRFEITPPRLLGSISLHSLARRYERGRDRGTEAIRADLAAIARAHAGVMEAPWGPFRIPAGAGCWVGEVVKASTGPCLSVRSYLD